MTSVTELLEQVRVIGAVQQAVEAQGQAIERLEGKVAKLTQKVAELRAGRGD